MKTMRRMGCGELVVRTWHGLRMNPQGLPVSHVRNVARAQGLNPGEVLSRILSDGKTALVSRGSQRWLVKGPRWDPSTAASEPR